MKNECDKNYDTKCDERNEPEATEDISLNKEKHSADLCLPKEDEAEAKRPSRNAGGLKPSVQAKTLEEGD